MDLKNYFCALTIFICSLYCFTAHGQANATRKVKSLNGTWQMAQSESFTTVPKLFNHKIPVPGLIDMAAPGIDTTHDNHLKGIVYWYKTNFKIDNDADLVKLKIYKSMYNTAIYLNGKLAGDNTYSFTPTTLDIKALLNPKGKANELLIAVGSIDKLPDTVTDGKDVEKIRYIPGIYDNVEIISSDYPFISNVQIAPEARDTSIRVQTKLLFGKMPIRGTLSYVVRELVSGKVVKTGRQEFDSTISDFKISLPGGKLWSPEQPFLYTLELKTDGDKKLTRFGIRSFEFKKGHATAFLNNKPYYLRGTNVTIMRFFEDAQRKDLPWKDSWVVKLHQGFKDMNWNAMRYCIGFPPERWYEVADSLGILIQDEYPIWQIKPAIKATHLANEYAKWMEERWNHPSVVVWDAQNETITKETGEAIKLVRSLDLSNRPWDNGFSPPQSETDPIESHPYLFIRYLIGETPSSAGPLMDMLSGFRLPNNDPNEVSPSPDGRYYYNPVIINEYSWLWLNRNGSTTTLTDLVYKTMFGDTISTGRKYELYARYVAALTEYWRAQRMSAAILHFCSLGYSRPDAPRGQTSDHFINIEKLENEPNFIKYVKPSFAPVGLMIDAWYTKYRAGQAVTIPVHVMNDTDRTFSDSLSLEIHHNDKVILSRKNKVDLDANGKQISVFRIGMPMEKGKYELVSFYYSGKEKVFSTRQFEIN